MPAVLGHPGVYIEEIPSGTRAISGVATSITAFLGRTPRGPVDEPVLVAGFADFERQFGGLWLDSALGYAVRDFFLNGGGQAVVVRLHEGAVTARFSLPTSEAGDNPLRLEASSPGAWGNVLQPRIDYGTREPGNPDLFNLTVEDPTTGRKEQLLNVSLREKDPRFLPEVLARESTLLRAVTAPSGGWLLPQPLTRPAETRVHLFPTLEREGTEEDREKTGGDGLSLARFIGPGLEADKRGLYALEKVDLFNLLCIPPYRSTGDVHPELVAHAAAYCERRRAILLVDPPSSWNSAASAQAGFADISTRSRNAALFFPRLQQPNPLRENQLETFAPCGAVAGVIARTDAQRGVWKAPAGVEATLTGVSRLSVSLTDAENGLLNPLGINCLRALPAAGRVVWGARTLQGADVLASEWKYLPVRRLALYLEESLYRGLQWAVFEPNDEALWAQLRLNVSTFLHGLFRQGAFQGRAPREAYFVKCDRETTTQGDIDRGVVNLQVGFAPLKPAEFVVLRLQQLAGQVEA